MKGLLIGQHEFTQMKFSGYKLIAQFNEGRILLGKTSWAHDQSFLKFVKIDFIDFVLTFT